MENCLNYQWVFLDSYGTDACIPWIRYRKNDGLIVGNQLPDILQIQYNNFLPVGHDRQD